MLYTKVVEIIPLLHLEDLIRPIEGPKKVVSWNDVEYSGRNGDGGKGSR